MYYPGCRRTFSPNLQSLETRRPGKQREETKRIDPFPFLEDSGYSTPLFGRLSIRQRRKTLGNKTTSAFSESSTLDGRRGSKSFYSQEHHQDAGTTIHGRIPILRRARRQRVDVGRSNEGRDKSPRLWLPNRVRRMGPRNGP